MVIGTTAKREEEGAAGAADRGASCRHHWLIQTAESRTSPGECLLCQARREFPNFLSDCLIDNDQEKFEEWLAREGRRQSKKDARYGPGYSN